MCLIHRHFYIQVVAHQKGTFHIGHLPGLRLCLAIQKHIRTPIEFMIADDEKIMRDDISMTEMSDNVSSTLAQLYKIGFTEENTQFRINSRGITSEEYALLIRMMSIVSVHTLNSIFGEKRNIGEYFYPLIQILPCLSAGRQCIVIAGLDQDPFFRLARDLARRIGFNPPIVLYTKSVPGLDGSEKMSTSFPASIPIFLDDTPETIATKIRQIRKVGAGSLDELFEKGADLSIDVPYSILSLFADQTMLDLITTAYTTGIADPTPLRLLATDKGIVTRDGRSILTSFGIRNILFSVLTHIIHDM